MANLVLNSAVAMNAEAMPNASYPVAPDTFERACIGSLLTVEAGEARKLAAAATADLFHNPTNAHVWQILRDSALSGSPLGLTTAHATISQAPRLLEFFSANNGSVEYHLESCIHSVEGRNHSWPRYVNELKLAHTRRRMIEAMDEAIVDAASASTATEATNSALSRVIETASRLRVVTKERSDDVRAATTEFLEDYDSDDVFYPFPQAGLNTLGGVRPGEIAIMSAYTGHGKSLWLMDWVLELLEANVGPIWIYSLEMSRKQVIRRILCMKFGWNMLDLVQRNVPRAEIQGAMEWIARQNLVIIDRNITSQRIQADVACAEVKPAVIGVDHMHLIPVGGGGGDDLTNFNSMVNGWKPFAIENDIAMVILAQMRRPQGMTGEKQPRPHLGMLKGSSAIEQIADYIIMLWKQKEESHAHGFGHDREFYEMWVEKQRDGEAAPAFEVQLQNLKFR